MIIKQKGCYAELVREFFQMKYYIEEKIHIQKHIILDMKR